MDNQIKNLDQFITQSLFTTQQGQGQTQFDLDLHSYNSYLTVLSINSVYRFPDVTDISNIPYDSVRNLARACLGFSKIALEIWNEVGYQNLRRTRLQRTG